MKRRSARNPYARVVDRDLFARNFLTAIEPLPTPELRRFLAKCREENSGTEGEALIIELIEGQLALREIKTT
ncbi:MAG: hypothetical protein ACREH8_21885 [Opitutaceae bacterium]